MSQQVNQNHHEKWNEMSENDFRSFTADFIETNLPKELRFMKRRPVWAESQGWYRKLAESGYLVPNWPVKYGGMGLSPSKQIIVMEEMERRGAPFASAQGPINVGPLLIAHGTEEQKAHYLPKILSGEHRWCQGYSEPNAGSDLASLRTEAVLDGDEFIINGSKTWTSMAFDATHIYALVRTDKTVKKQQGISFLLIDMDQPGVKVRPITNIMGHPEQCEVYFENARAPRSDLVGNLNEGWTVAKSLLGFERLYNGSPAHCAYALAHLERTAKLIGCSDDPVFVDRLTQIQFDVLDLASAYNSLVRVVREGGSFGPEASLLKIWATETCQKITEFHVEIAGAFGGLSGDFQVGNGTADVLFPFLNSRVLTIYGGSSQVQRNILSSGTLGLPK